VLQKAISQTRLAEVLNLSRQTLYNYRESYRLFGVTGLLHGYSPSPESVVISM
jgi:20S proteasome alpha/beta subunit